MKLSIAQQDLKNILISTASISPPNPHVRILENIYLQLEKNSLTSVGTDSDIEVASCISLDAKHVHEEGEITVPARKFLEICNSLPAGSIVDIQHEGNNIGISSGKTSFSLATIEADEFPKKILDFNAKECFEVSREELLKGITKTSFSVAQNHMHPFFTGLLFELDSESGLNLVATDGHRLAKTCIKVSDGKNVQAIMPYKAVGALSKILSQEHTGQKVKVQINESQIQVSLDDDAQQSGHCYLACNLIAGQYPDYKRAIPSNDKILSISISRSILSDAIGRASILANEKYRGVGLDITKNSILITNKSVASNIQKGDKAQEEIEVEHTGEDASAVFNAGYLMAVLNACKSDNVTLSLSKDLVATIQDEKDSNTLFVVMPIRC